MENSSFPIVLGWEDLKGSLGEEDYLITYLLYQEGKSVDLIAKIRNLPIEQVQQHILQSKMRLKREKKVNQDVQEKIVYLPSFVNLLAADKNRRLEMLNSLDQRERNNLSGYLIKVVPTIDNAEDKMIALWISGQLEDIRLLPTIYREINHKHGGVRRMVCSALRKIPHQDNIEVLHRGLQDMKPQVRQYAAKALGEVGDEKTLKKLKNLLNNPKETEYVKRAYLLTIDKIQERLNSRSS
ncbi:HEAT repeat domain-containing protein [Alkaliphilus hydrothermalis]|uniref:Helicase Helix-turn-helix domain-containing protein n=1 Tax=Alkaliphilus hydrothermalis TaxID=1482730 RepID=A0ABS2NKT4_9FIRM|nr:HEAT repeat domain-containing protein [Alkaliphilus hydrothermalis]MBM7613543.1 hypothetical protein [Alkaliphilus hydrothermalis]